MKTMNAKMNAKDLEYLKEITGLVSEGETQVTNNTMAVAMPDDENLKVWVGKFVDVTDKTGTHTGMIDRVHGKRLGFVFATKDGWTARLVWPANVRVASDEKRAKRSAETYYNEESTSLRCRIRRNIVGDDKVMLNRMLANCESWLRKLA